MRTTFVWILAAAVAACGDQLPRGGETWIEAEDTSALRAIHEFLAFQRLDHRAMGHDMH